MNERSEPAVPDRPHHGPRPAGVPQRGMKGRCLSCGCCHRYRRGMFTSDRPAVIQQSGTVTECDIAGNTLRALSA
jgi:hypothetical protein